MSREISNKNNKIKLIKDLDILCTLILKTKKRFRGL